MTANKSGIPIESEDQIRQLVSVQIEAPINRIDAPSQANMAAQIRLVLKTSNKDMRGSFAPAFSILPTLAVLRMNHKPIAMSATMPIR